MMHVKVKTKDVQFNLPIPYAFLNVAVSIVSSKLFQQKAHKWTKERLERKKLDFAFPQLDKKTLKPIVKELKKHKGIVLVDVKANDGTEVKVRL
ncbi:MAG: hypothetical protein ACI4XS_13210 [Bacillus sp. (in: firmicutes)]